MSITKKGSKRATSQSLKGKKIERHALPEPAIRDLIGGLGIHDVSVVAARFQVVADLTKASLERDAEQLDASALQLVKEVAAESGDKHYRRLMKTIVARVTQGRQGISVAHVIASRVVELAFRWTREYLLAFQGYRERLRTMSRAAKGRSAKPK